MLTLQEARTIAEDKLKSMSTIDDIVIIDSETIEKSYAWIFSYNTIEAYEEREKIWELTLTGNIYSDTEKLLSLKRTLDLSNQYIAGYKSSHKLVLDTGSATRLSSLQKDLSDKGIQTRLIMRDLI